MRKMTRIEVNNKLAEIAQYRMLKAEAEAELTKLEDELKAYMTESELTELIGDEHKVTYKFHEVRRFDSTAFKKAGYGDLYEEYRTPRMEPRFTFA